MYHFFSDKDTISVTGTGKMLLSDEWQSAAILNKQV